MYVLIVFKCPNPSMSGSQKEKRGESPEALKKFPESYFNQPGLKQWWAPSVSATL